MFLLHLKCYQYIPTFTYTTVLHLWASIRRLFQAPTYYSNTNFYIRDLWKVDLSNADVIAVYGLQPIMTKLGLKMKEELKPGSIVVSNVFEIPGWKPSGASRNGVHLYCIPECWDWSDGRGSGGSYVTNGDHDACNDDDGPEDDQAIKI
uniref:Uncharacterized protein n=1 Tax=Ditylum brightwellii TaxID=49249 RepID=A0A7S4VKA5_9STRA|mmetsp:Transcript_52431/g.78146  ORF Transcript_52431/g.78146 Transcript_52431/m.78146 type:complete len:149 (+) Transcript_52431:8-454(+)